MITRTGYLLMMAVLLAGGERRAVALEDAHEMVRKADLTRGPERPFTMKMELTDRKGKDVIAQTGVMVNFHDPGRTMIEYVHPKKDEGRKILRVGENMWIRIPSTKRAIRITPQQRLIGQVSNGDVLSTNYAEDYGAKYLGAEKVTTTDGKTIDCHKLELVKKSNAATYHRLFYYVEAQGYRPVKAEFFTQTGKLLKTAHFLAYGNYLGASRPSKILIVNAVETEQSSVIDIVNYGESNMPSSSYSESSLNQ